MYYVRFKAREDKEQIFGPFEYEEAYDKVGELPAVIDCDYKYITYLDEQDDQDYVDLEGTEYLEKEYNQ